jgi:hypothetical protein
LGIASGPPAPAPELPLLDPELPPPELPPPEPPLDAELLVPVLVVVLDVAPVSLQYVGSWVQSWLVEVPAVWAAAGDVANNNAIREASLIMSKPRSINRLSGDDRGIAPLRTSLITLGSVQFLTLPTINRTFMFVTNIARP